MTLREQQAPEAATSEINEGRLKKRWQGKSNGFFSSGSCYSSVTQNQHITENKPNLPSESEIIRISFCCLAWHKMNIPKQSHRWNYKDTF